MNGDFVNTINIIIPSLCNLTGTCANYLYFAVISQDL